MPGLGLGAERRRAVRAGRYFFVFAYAFLLPDRFSSGKKLEAGLHSLASHSSPFSPGSSLKLWPDNIAQVLKAGQEPVMSHDWVTEGGGRDARSAKGLDSPG